MTNIEKFKAWVRDYESVEHWIRMIFHTRAVQVLTLLNMSLGIIGFLTWFKLCFGISFFIPHFVNVNWPSYLLIVYLPLLTWFYSTITQPIKDGFKIKVDWTKEEKGRLHAFIRNIIPFIFLLWASAAKYIHENYEPLIGPIRVDPNQYNQLLVTNMDSLIKLLYFLPVFFTLILLVVYYRHYAINKDILRDQFFKWQFPPLARFSHNLVYDQFDVIVGWDKKTKKPLILKQKQRFLHELVNGATGSGKTSTAILVRIAQDLIKISKGIPGGIVVLEPKGDLVDDVVKLAKELGVPDEKIMVIDPTKDQSTKFNPFYGPIGAAAESFRGTITALTENQDTFFKGQQEETAAFYTMLAKILFGNLTNITHIQQMFLDARYLATLTERARAIIEEHHKNESMPEKVLNQWDGIVRYFEDDVLDYKTFRDKDEIKPVLYPEGHRYAGKQMVESKKDKFVTGAKKYLNDISMNAMLSQLMISQDGENVLNLDDFLENGGVLLINTALGELEELSLLFGQFFIRQFQSAVFRRPKDGAEIGSDENKRIYKRIPIFFNVDEFPLYINQAFERMLTLGRSYNVGSLIAIQSLGQLETVIKGYRQTIMTNASSKTVFGRGVVDDNKIFSETFLEDKFVEESLNESTTPVTIEKQQWGYRHNTQKILAPAFTPSDIARLPFKHMIVQLVNEDESLEDARIATGTFVSESKFLKRYFKKQLDIKSEQSEETDDTEYNLVDSALGHLSGLSDEFPSMENAEGGGSKDTKVESPNEPLASTATQPKDIDEPETTVDNQTDDPNDKWRFNDIMDDIDSTYVFEDKEVSQGTLLFKEVETGVIAKPPKQKKLSEANVENHEEMSTQQLTLQDMITSPPNTEETSGSESHIHSIPDKETNESVDSLLKAVEEAAASRNFNKDNQKVPNSSGITENLEIVEDDL
ncbi:type IV secretory system conjugative DNA transfer family protein (plasmid) [Cytobacillus firmus]|uniref:type IV secretory system conjugative DNA transfer family protein n=1 Tax=Bacillaceae TaxID=186817 RepID=UPI001A90253F|nr:type IV secretory system conjugative DNA transfer family protein [Bacillus sp. NTK034]MBN8202556.1 type IV secretory system conjugative DNA transfer family protein [Bacillus sp. NTK034]